ncbi:DUF1127 domain-containing protein [Bradyrhizobium sp. NBAIM03]|uniref:DUF1127 domain-containing protein n=1 Tax=Bradyrhizobium sp. NBAIM03 TaxID=2793816 RepID=UPI001CD22228|nr:DUF1127 domain-containing protein [Bradyrhizobium sp. NBAIM03]MCA1536686.1 DUF1127 domain-containing protein [Bradyrhizobium sp. NBAIM03]
MMKTHSQKVVKLVRPDGTGRDGQDTPALSGRSSARRLDVDRIGTQGLSDSSAHRAPDEAKPDRGGIIWSVILAFMEGFALYGAALHPTAAMPVHEILAARRDREPNQPVDRVGRLGAEDDGKVMQCVLPRKAQPERRYNWLRSAGDKLALLRLHLRREGKVRGAVPALMKLDDRTLRDIGIHGRSEIEWAVRRCYDCCDDRLDDAAPIPGRAAEPPAVNRFAAGYDCNEFPSFGNRDVRREGL